MFKSFFIFIAIHIIRAYQVLHHSFFTGSCRFNPTCSQYFIDALNEFGLFKGAYLGCKRILRCHPFGGAGYDPVPKKNTTADEVKVG